KTVLIRIQLVLQITDSCRLAAANFTCDATNRTSEHHILHPCHAFFESLGAVQVPRFNLPGERNALPPEETTNHERFTSFIACESTPACASRLCRFCSSTNSST